MIARLTEGGKFGDYTVVRLLGRGGMGEVWLLEGASGRQVAAKLLESSADHESRKRFLREAELALGVKHPNLVETYDVGEDPETGFCYILMEYVPGGTLSDYLKQNGALPIEDAVAVVEAMAAVLELGRQKGIVHRDIKPANIMFDADGTPKLADLGIARGGAVAGTETTTVTQTGMMIGTPAYMAPEQMLDAHNVDTRADIYSLGVVFFEMLTGERPNKDDTIVQLMAKAVKGEPLPDVRTLRPEVSASLAQLLNMMVAPDKDGRISTPGQITNALAIIERGGEFVDAESLPRQNKDVSISERRGKDSASTNGRARIPAAPHEEHTSFSWKVLVPVGILAVLATVFVLLSTKHESARSVVTTNVVERVVEKPVIQTVVQTNIIEKTVGRVDRNNRSEIHVGGECVDAVSSLRHPSFEWIANPLPPKVDAKILVVGLREHLQGEKRERLLSYFAPVEPNVPVRVECAEEFRLDDLDGYVLVFLWSRSLKIPYSDSEMTSLSRYLAEGGNVVVLADRPDGAQDALLRRFGLRVQRLVADLPLKGVCPVLSEMDVYWRATGRGHPLKGNSDWLPMVVHEDVNPNPVMAVRPVGKGKLFFMAPGKGALHAGNERNRAWWRRVLQGCGIPIRSVSEPTRALPVDRPFDPKRFKDPDATRATQKAFDTLFPGWKVSAVEQSDAPWAFGYQAFWRGRKDVVSTMPVTGEKPCVISRKVKVSGKHPLLVMEVASQNVDTDFLLTVRIDGWVAFGPRLVCTPEAAPYERIGVPLAQWKGKVVTIAIEHACNNWFYEHAFWSRLEIVEGTGKEMCGPVGIASTEVFPCANLQNKKWMKRTPWSYTTSEPAANWKDPDFDDSKWKHTKKALGCDKGQMMTVADEWRSGRIWIRRKFLWRDSRPVYKAVFDLCYDQDVEIYLNGLPVQNLGGWNMSWNPYSAWTKAFVAALRQGENTLAVTLKGDSPSYFDCGLTIEMTEPGSVSKKNQK